MVLPAGPFQPLKGVLPITAECVGLGDLVSRLIGRVPDQIIQGGVRPLICRRICWSQASPPRSSLWSNQTSIPTARSASVMRWAGGVSSRA